jgi:Tfp pilus assembly protein PilO
MLATRTSRWSAVTALVCLVLLAATWFLLVSPRRADVTQINEERLSAEAANLTLERRIVELREQYGELAALEAERDAIRAQLPPAAAVPSLVRNLSTLAGDAGIELLSVTPGTPRVLDEGTPGTKPAVVAVPVSVEASGGYTEVTLFLKYLQTKLSRVFLITTVSVNRGEVAAATTTTPTVTGTATPTATTSPTASPTPTATATTSATASPTATSNDFSLSITGEVYAMHQDGLDAFTATPTPTATGAAPTPTATGAAPTPTATGAAPSPTATP